MKKLFLGTTVLAAGLFAGSAMAEQGPKITVGGVSDFQAAFVEEDLIGQDKDIVFRNDNEIMFSVDGDYNGVGYGAVIELEADVGGETAGGANADRTYVYISGDNWGRLEFGSNNAASDIMQVDGASVARATGGIDGDFYRYLLNPPADNNGDGVAEGVGSALIRPSSPMGAFGFEDQGEESNKLTYYTPKFGGMQGDDGFQIGVSYTPQSGDVGQLVTDTSDYENIFSVGAKYEGQFDQVGFALSGTFDSGDAVNAGDEDIMAWQFGAQVDVQGFQIAASYSDWDDSFNGEWTYLTAGVAYAMDKFGVSATYLQAEEDVSGNEFTNIVIGADYKLAPGIFPYAEVAIVDDEFTDNDGTIALVGTELTF